MNLNMPRAFCINRLSLIQTRIQKPKGFGLRAVWQHPYYVIRIEFTNTALIFFLLKTFI